MLYSRAISLFLVSFTTLLFSAEVKAAREAAFADTGASIGGSAAVSDAMAVEPKSEIDTGESVVNIARRTTIFFVNKSNAPVEVISVTTSDDGNVKSSVISDDCSSQQKIGGGSRCSVVVETTPSNAGPWTTEVLLTHKGAGRIARAKLTGKASGQFSAEKKEAGFALSTKDIKPIDFGEVEINSARVVRTALMVNDSPETITLLSIDVIAAENGLERLDQGCVIDLELKPGESCPVTLVWKPAQKGIISTDLIIRHSGRLGFAVIPIRGNAKEPKDTTLSEIKSAKSQTGESGKAEGKSARQPTAAEEVEKILADKIPPLSLDHIAGAFPPGISSIAHATQSGEFRLIGTVGNRAILLKPDGKTVVAGLNEDISYGDGKTAKLVNVMPKTAEIFVDGKKKTLQLSAATELINKAVSSASPSPSGASLPAKQQQDVKATLQGITGSAGKP